MKIRRYALLALGLPAVSLLIPAGISGAVVKHPNSNIALNTKSVAVYKPAKLSVTVGGGTCTQKNYTFQVSNETAVSQQVEENKMPVGGPIGPEAVPRLFSRSPGPEGRPRRCPLPPDGRH